MNTPAPKKKLHIAAKRDAEQGSERQRGFSTSSKSAQSEEKLKVLSLRIPERLHRKLKATAGMEGATITQKVTEWIEGM